MPSLVAQTKLNTRYIRCYRPLGFHNFMHYSKHGLWRKGEVCTRFWWGNLRERHHWGDQDVDGRIILRWVFRKCEGVVETGWSWLRIGTGGERL